MKINANGTEISVLLSKDNTEDYISLTDIAKHKNADDPRIVISNWMSSYSTIDFLATWEKLYNPDFNRMEFQTVEQLIVLVNLESMNADMIRQGISKYDRLQKLRSVAYYQLASLKKTNAAKAIEAAVAKQLPE